MDGIVKCMGGWVALSKPKLAVVENIDTNYITDAYLLLDQSALMHYADVQLCIYPCPASV